VERTIRSVTVLLSLLVMVVLAATSISATGDKPLADSAAKHANRPTPEEVERAIDLATGYLERACGPDGKFVYMVDTGSGRESLSYNIIRHAGAMYALAMVNRSHHDQKTVGAMVRAAKFLRENYIGPGAKPDQLAVWSKPLNDRAPAKGNYAELGGTGLGLVALAAARQVQPSAVPLEDLQALGRFLLYLLNDDGSFVQKYNLESGPVPDWKVLYYPGEAALGFIALYEADHSAQWLLAAGKALSYLAKSRVGIANVPDDHWALIATAALMPYIEQVRSVVSRERLVQHAVQICNSIVREQFRSGAAIGLDGAFDPTGRTAPAATCLEGLLAAMEFLPKGELQDRVEATTARGVGFLLRAQITSGQFTGGMPGAVRTSVLDSSDIRVDYVQHALCAWLRYQNGF